MRTTGNWPRAGRLAGEIIRSTPIQRCPGWASTTEPGGYDYGPDPQYNCTNIYSLEQGAIWTYTKQPGIYRCPAAPGRMGGWPILRSYSMNSWMAGRTEDDPTGRYDLPYPGAGYEKRSRTHFSAKKIKSCSLPKSFSV